MRPLENCNRTLLGVVGRVIGAGTHGCLVLAAVRAVTINGKPHTDFDPQKETVRIVPGGAAPIVVRGSY